MNQIQQVFSKKLPISIIPDMVTDIVYIVKKFEMRDEHSYTLNSPFIGCYKFSFNPEDRMILFNLVNTDEAYVKSIIKEISSITQSFKVISDPFNLLSIWIIHKFYKSRLTQSQKETSILNIGNYLQYKLLGSLIANFFKYKADIDYMSIVIEDLTNKSDIKNKGSWKKLIEDRTKQMFLDTSSIHYKSLTKFDDDKKILYAISDLQTRMRNQIKLIAQLYYDYYSKRTKIESVEAVTTIDGKKIFKEPKATIELMNYVILSDIKFGSINQKYLQLILVLYKNVIKSVFIRAFTMLHNAYIEQMKQKKLDAIAKPSSSYGDCTELYIGVQVFVNKLIQFTFSQLMKNSIQLNRKSNIVISMYKTFSSQKLRDQLFLNLKGSLKHFLISYNITRRKTTISSLIPALMLYLMLIGFNSLTRH